jgi:hypothetical protein
MGVDIGARSAQPASGTVQARGEPRVEPALPETCGSVYADHLFTNLFARHFQRGCTGSGTYRWGLEDTHLAIEALDDTCLLRIALPTFGNWTRLSE